MDFRGSYVPLITPFNRKGRLDRKTLERLVEWHIAEGTDGIICSATTGEGVCLSDAERKTVAQICIRTSAGRIPIIVSTGTNDTRTSVQYTESAQKCGANGCLVVTPYYNKPSQRGCYLHFQEVARVGLPIIVYHNPGRAVIRLTIETMREISRLPHIAAIKETSRDLEFVRKLIPLLPVFSGDDDITFAVMKEGGVGSIVPTANLVPKGWKQMVQLCLQGRWEQAEILAQRYLPLNRALYLETNPQCVKFALSWLGKCSPTLRLPMILPAEEAQNELKKAILHLALPHFESKTQISH